MSRMSVCFLALTRRGTCDASRMRSRLQTISTNLNDELLMPSDLHIHLVTLPTLAHLATYTVQERNTPET